jgi:hypothetical protein
MILRSEQEIDSLIADMVRRGKGKYITQGVSFNKTCPRQMALLKKALMESASFSGLAKEMLALRFEGGHIQNFQTIEHVTHQEPEKPKTKNVGNFI